MSKSNGDIIATVIPKNTENTVIPKNTENTVVLYIKNEFSEKINIEFKNNISATTQINVIKSSNKDSNFNIYSSSGNVILYEDFEIQKNTIADMYNYKITVEDADGNVLFKGSSSDNIRE